MFRNGWENNVKSIDALPYVTRVQTPEPAILAAENTPLCHGTNEGVRCAERRTASGLGVYHTPRAQYPTAPGYATLRSLTRLLPMMLTIWRKCT